MMNMRSCLSLICWGLLLAARASAAPSGAELLTVAEKSRFAATANYEETSAWVDQLCTNSPLARRLELGRSTEGRSIPLLILADPPVASVEQARSQPGKLVVLMLGNLHGGEVDGKEALCLLAREICQATNHPFLKDFILAIVPLYNPDGNERMAPDHRPNQDGPRNGMGIRANGQGLDLNRDLVKLEAPETRALVGFLNEWDPALVLDLHTTDGSFHRNLVTYVGPNVLAGSKPLAKYVRNDFLPAVRREVKRQAGFNSFVYGNFDASHAQWRSVAGLGRYASSYVGLRGRIGILLESYSHASYKKRVLGLRDFVRVLLAQAAAQKAVLQKNLAQARSEAMAGVPTEDGGTVPEAQSLVAIRSELAPAAKKAKIAGFVEELRDNRPVSTGRPQTYEVELWDRARPLLSVRRPFAYVFPGSQTNLAAHLQRHGIEVDVLREDLDLDLETYRIDAVARDPGAFQKHNLRRIEATARQTHRRVPAGSFVVRARQKLADLIVYLLEPQSEDGLAVWNFFDDGLQAQGDFPVQRLPQAIPLFTARTPSLTGPKPPARITYEGVFELGQAPNLAGSPAGGYRWLEDDRHFLLPREGRLRKVEAATGQTAVFYEAGPLAAALAKIPGLDSQAAQGLAGRAGDQLSPDHAATLLQYENDLYYARLDGSQARRLTATPEPEELATFSPDGRWVAFVRKNDLHVVEVASGTERALTTGATDLLLNGKADWIYFEEVFNRNYRAYWWSPDSRRIAFFQTDDSPLPTFTLVNDLPRNQVLERARYPRPGEPNPRVRLGVVNVAGGSPRFADLSDYDVEGHLLTAVGWWPDSSNLYCCVQDRAQTWLDFCSVSPAGGSVARLFRDQTKAWIEAPEKVVFGADGSFTLTSERSGWKHLYHYSRQGTLKKALTSGDWEVRHILHLDEPGQWLYFTGTRDNLIGENLYRVSLTNQAIERLTRAPGSHRIQISPRGGLFIDHWSGFESPAQVALRKTDGSLVRRLDLNPVPGLAEWVLGKRERASIPMADGFQVEAVWTLPPDFDARKKYPVWLMTYAGPQMPSIADAWSGSVWDQVLAAAGIIALHVDPRPASGKGAQSAWTAYKQLGVQELKDLEGAVAWFQKKGWVDGTRIGLSGYSYGGFMTAFALTHSKMFAAGIAGGSPTDWRDYDSIYTERYMQTPQNNPDGYQATSVVKAARNLHGRLLLVHGLLDDNVHPANSLKLIQALQQAGQQFDMMLYPDYRHGIGGGQYQRAQYDFILRTLGVSPGKTGPPAAPAGK